MSVTEMLQDTHTSNASSCDSFRYGVNPHESVATARLPRLRLVGGGAVSVNAYLDLYAGYQVSEAGSARAVYLKHLTPLFTHQPGPEGAAIAPALLRMNEERGFGCFVFRGTVTAAIARALLAIPAHTIAAEAFSADAIEYLRSDPIQRANRGLTLVEAQMPQVARSQFALANEVHEIVLSDLKPAPTGPDHIHRILKFCRTIATNLYVSGELAYTVCGEFDVTAGLDRALETATRAGLHGVTVATDACFGVKSPASLLREHRVSRLFTFGEKSSAQALTAELARSGIEHVANPQRAFSYLP